jgi:class 3 adenylate cyclase
VSATPVQRRLAAILSADVAGFSGLMQADEAATLTAIKRARQEIVEPAIAQHGGHLFKLMGDGLLAEFASIVSAVESALAIQDRMASSASTTGAIRFRIGVNLGDVIVDEGDVYGDGVNLAARLQTLARWGVWPSRVLSANNSSARWTVPSTISASIASRITSVRCTPSASAMLANRRPLSSGLWQRTTGHQSRCCHLPITRPIPTRISSPMAWSRRS